MANGPLFPQLGPQLGSPGSQAAPAVPNLFGEAPKNSAPVASAKPSNMVDAAMAKADTTTKVLGPKPKMTPGIEVEEESFSISGALFKFTLVALVALYAFFYSQLSPTFNLFGENSVQRLTVFQESFAEEQTTINFHNMLIAKFALDQFSVTADAYLFKWAQYQSEYTPKNTKDDLEHDLEILNEEMLASLTIAKEKFSHLLYPKDIAYSSDAKTLNAQYIQLLKDRIAEERKALTQRSDANVATDENNLNSIFALVSAVEFQGEIKSLDLSNPLSSGMVQHLFQEATRISTNEFATILNIKSQRVNWSEIFNELEKVTQDVDPLYGSGIKSNITYSNLSLNASDQSIALRGSTKTDDTRNFSLVSDLMDRLEQSPLFWNVSERTFSKNENQTKGFTSSFNISLMLQYEPDERDEASVNLTGDSSQDSAPSTVPRMEETRTESPTEEEAEFEVAVPEETAPAGAEPQLQTEAESESSSLDTFSAANFFSIWESITDTFWGDDEPISNGGRIPRY